jgi:two-component system, chemotaxis family, CheB/CheR fusion protein
LQQHFWHKDEAFRLLIEGLDDYAVIGMNLDGMVELFNTGAERMFGWSADEVCGRSGFIIFTPEDRQLGAPMHELVVAREKGKAVDERWHVRKDGSRFWATGLMFLVKNEDGRPSGYAKILRDLDRWPTALRGEARDAADVPS